MATTYDHVIPGDLITAKLWNQLVDDLSALDERVGKLEAAAISPNAPFLTGRDPKGDVTVGSRLTLTGRNFLKPANLNTVRIGSVSINQFFPESDDENLVFTIPSLFGNLPADMTVMVRNDNGDSNALSIGVLPLVVVPQGQVVFTYATGDLGTINAGGTYTFRFLVDSQTNIPEIYELSVVYTSASGATASAWTDATQLSPIGIQQISRGQPLPVSVTVKIPSGAVSVQMALHVRSLNNDIGLSRSSDPVSITVGQQQEENDSRTTFVLSNKLNLFDFNIRNADIAVGGVTFKGAEIRYGQTGTISVIATFTDAGKYAYYAEVENPDNFWKIESVDPSNSIEAASGGQTIAVKLTCQASAASNELRFMKVYAIHRNASDTEDDFQSFIRFPVRGASF